MKIRPILPDPLTLRAAGVRSFTELILLIHVGRCGLAGTTINGAADAITTIHHNTIYTAIERLCDAKLLTRSSVIRKQGRPVLYIVTVAGWNALTTPADFSLFAGADREPMV